jgi:hypothetical protein
MFKYANSRTAIRKAALILAALFLNVTVTTQFAFSDTAPPFWPPPSPPAPDDGIYTSPFTFNSLSNGGTVEPDAGPDVRLAARWQLLGGPVAPPLAQAMAKEAEAQRQRNAQQLPGGAGTPGMPTWVSLGPTTQNRWTLGFSLGLPNPQINSGRLSSILRRIRTPYMWLPRVVDSGRQPTSPSRTPRGPRNRMESLLLKWARALWARVRTPFILARAIRLPTRSVYMWSVRRTGGTTGRPGFNCRQRLRSI